MIYLWIGEIFYVDALTIFFYSVIYLFVPYDFFDIIPGQIKVE